MSKAYKCDRCGKLYEPNNSERISFDGRPLSTLAIGDYNSQSFHSPFDICQECAKEFVTWWKLGEV